MDKVPVAAAREVRSGMTGTAVDCCVVGYPGYPS